MPEVLTPQPPLHDWRGGVGAEKNPERQVDPWAAPSVTLEVERLPERRLISSATVFLIGAECRFSCVFCDLWRHTLEGPTPPGAIPHQLGLALAGLERDGQRPTQLKLYNASNYFDERAIPEADDAAIGALVGGFERVVVECHPKLIGGRCFDVAATWRPRLQVAMGLETVHPEAARRIRKGCLPDDFRRAAATLREREVGVRAFVLLGVPFVPAAEAVEWAVRSVAFAADAGAEHVALIPLRTTEVEEVETPSLAELEAALDGALGLAPVVTGDLWDFDRLRGGCGACRPMRRARLARLNETGVPEPTVSCEACA